MLRRNIGACITVRWPPQPFLTFKLWSLFTLGISVANFLCHIPYHSFQRRNKFSISINRNASAERTHQRTFRLLVYPRASFVRRIIQSCDYCLLRQEIHIKKKEDLSTDSRCFRRLDDWRPEVPMEEGWPGANHPRPPPAQVLPGEVRQRLLQHQDQHRWGGREEAMQLLHLYYFGNIWSLAILLLFRPRRGLFRGYHIIHWDYWLADTEYSSFTLFGGSPWVSESLFFPTESPLIRSRQDPRHTWS